MNEFWWTFAVASVSAIAGYLWCGLLSLDTRQKNERAIGQLRKVCVVDSFVVNWDGMEVKVVEVEDVIRVLEGNSNE